MSHEQNYGKNCEAPLHVEDCHGLGSTRDHFTPLCIGKLWGWSQEQLDSEENTQYLSPACHRAKDQDTPLRKEVLGKQLRGEINLTFAQHVEIFNGGERL